MVYNGYFEGYILSNLNNCFHFPFHESLFLILINISFKNDATFLCSSLVFSGMHYVTFKIQISKLQWHLSLS